MHCYLFALLILFIHIHIFESVSSIKECSSLKCKSCYIVDYGTRLHEVCVITKYVPHQFELYLQIEIDKKHIKTTSIGPHNLPICTTQSPIHLCVVVKHIDIKKVKLCTSIDIRILLNLVRLLSVNLPCVKLNNGKLVLEDNKY